MSLRGQENQDTKNFNLYLQNTFITDEEREICRKADAAILRSLAVIDGTMKRVMVKWTEGSKRRLTRSGLMVFRKDVGQLVRETEELIGFLEIIAREGKRGRAISQALTRFFGFTKYQKKDTPQRRGRKPKYSAVSESVLDAFGAKSIEELLAVAKETTAKSNDYTMSQIKTMKEVEKKMESTDVSFPKSESEWLSESNNDEN